MSQSSFTILIVTYNSGSEISNLLNDLLVCAPGSKTIVIDNASRDETVALVQEHFPYVQLIRNFTNLGYAKAVNQGFALCDTEYVLLLNPDIRINSQQLFTEMERCMKHSRQVAVTAPLQFKEEDGKQRLNFTWSYATLDTFKLYLSYLLKYTRSMNDPMRVTFLNAGCLLIRRAAFEQVGRLNEKYFLYGEEPDLFLKLRRHGFECYLLPSVGVTHYRERSLMTRPASERLQIRFRAAWNVTDALIHGWANILLDQLALKTIPFVTRKRQTTYKKRLPSNPG